MAGGSVAPGTATPAWWLHQGFLGAVLQAPACLRQGQPESLGQCTVGRKVSPWNTQPKFWIGPYSLAPPISQGPDLKRFGSVPVSLLGDGIGRDFSALQDKVSPFPSSRGSSANEDTIQKLEVSFLLINNIKINSKICSLRLAITSFLQLKIILFNYLFL